MNERGTSARNPALTVVRRAVVAAIPVVLMTLAMTWVNTMLTHYAVHLCRWPATISCHDGWGGWQLARMWFLLISAICLSGVALWVARGPIVTHLWPVVGITVGFPVLVLASGPRLLGGVDLFVFGIYGTFAVAISWQVLSEWFPAARRVLAVIAVAIAVVQLGVVVTTPSVLASVADRNGLTQSP